jgi:hypothetical protein
MTALAMPAVGFAAPGKKTAKPVLPKGKPFQYLNSRIDLLIGRVDDLEAWRTSAEATLAKLELNTAANAAAIAILELRIQAAEEILATKQDIIEGECPAGQAAVSVAQATDTTPATLVCSASVGANGLSVSTVEVYQDIAPTSNADVIAVCPAGTVPMGGSYMAGAGLTVVSTDIVDTGYKVTVGNESTTITSSITVTAKCLGIGS